MLEGSEITAEQVTEKGLLAGDIVATVTAAFGIPPCGGCEKRRQWMNRVHQWIRDQITGSR